MQSSNTVWNGGAALEWDSLFHDCYIRTEPSFCSIKNLALQPSLVFLLLSPNKKKEAASLALTSKEEGRVETRSGLNTICLC